MMDSEFFSTSTRSLQIQPEEVFDDEERRTLARQETKAVSYLRLLVVIILFLTAVFVVLGVYIYTKSNEQQEFDQHFEINSQKILETFHDSVERKLGSINTLATSITSLSITNNVSFPFVHVDHFPLRAADVRVLADAVVIHWLPLVEEENRAAWEKFSYKNRFQIDIAYEEEVQFRTAQDEFLGLLPDETKTENENVRSNHTGTDGAGRSLQESDGQQQQTTPTQQQPEKNPNVLDDGTGYHMKIWSKKTKHAPVPDGTGPYLPLWQRSPVNAQRQAIQNMDFISLKPAMPVILRDQEVIIDKVVVPEGHLVEVFNKNLLIGHERHNDPGQFISDPISFMAYPVFDKFGDGGRVAGLLAINMYWRYYFKNILPTDAKGFYCVLENSFNQTYTFRLDGPNVTYLGDEDLHDPDYNDYEVRANVNEYVRQRAGADTRAYTTVPLSTTYGVYNMRIYPSRDTEAMIKTNKPVIYTIAIALVFLLTSLAFSLFNYFVERRQGMVMDRAVQSGAIVSSLFPKQVHDRLYEESLSVDRKKSTTSVSWTVNSSNEWKVTNRGVDDINNINNVNQNSNARSSKLIADSFPETTVMFGDLAGFTEWSSTRQPEEVFHLLETVYDQFDKIALRRKVFKVETIGDCYLAVAGLPTPQPDHAVIMAKFARDCLNKMEESVRSLNDRLGEDTLKLQLRVGLHSGPVTAGVLRGQKSRFQLFGDTVNTAARMETNGEPGRIHVSQETANQLDSYGKSSWLVPREEKIVAKGKGELQTYWIIVQGEKSVYARSTRSTVISPQSPSATNGHDDDDDEDDEVLLVDNDEKV